MPTVNQFIRQLISLDVDQGISLKVPQLDYKCRLNVFRAWVLKKTLIPITIC